jgi:hypothetical protein
MAVMKMRAFTLIAIVTLGGATSVPAQSNGPVAPTLAGTWQASTPEGAQTIVVQADSTASFGEETVRWRTSKDTIYIQFGDEWIGYNFVLEGDTLTLSGGDLEEPIELRRVGPPPKDRHASVAAPVRHRARDG